MESRENIMLILFNIKSLFSILQQLLEFIDILYKYMFYHILNKQNKLFRSNFDAFCIKGCF